MINNDMSLQSDKFCSNNVKTSVNYRVSRIIECGKHPPEFTLWLNDSMTDVNFRHSSQYCKVSLKLCTKKECTCVYMVKEYFGKYGRLHIFKIPPTSFTTTYFIFQQFVMGTTTGGKTSCDIASRIQLRAHSWRNKLSLKYKSISYVCTFKTMIGKTKLLFVKLLTLMMDLI